MNSEIASFLQRSAIAPRAENAIDVSAWIGQYPFRGIVNSAICDLRKLADDLGISRIIASPFEAVFWENGLEAYARSATEFAGDPLIEVWPVVRPGAMHKLEQLLDRHQPRGMRLVPGYHGFHMYDKSVELLMALVRERKMIVQIFTRIADERWHYMLKVPELPFHDIEYATSIFNDQPILVSGLNSPQALVDRMKQHPALYTDVSRIRGPVFGMEQVAPLIPAGRLMFGSLWPIQIIEATLWQVTSAKIDDALKRAILYDNVDAMLTASYSGAT